MGEAIITRRACRSLPNTPIEAGSLTFTTSQIWTSPFTGYIDIFLVNGGNGGGSGFTGSGYHDSSTANSEVYSGRGGASGKCKTISQVKIYEGQTYEVVIGAGGQGSSEHKDYDIGSSTSVHWSLGGSVSNTGGTTSFGVWSNTPQYSYGVPAPSSETADAYTGGGSDGGTAAHFRMEISALPYHELAGDGTNGGSAFNQGQVWYAGSGGSGGAGVMVRDSSTSVEGSNGGSAGGGNGGSGATTLSGLGIGTDGTPNTGGGGGAGGCFGYSYINSSLSERYRGGCGYAAGGNGGSGVVIIKWNDDGQPT